MRESKTKSSELIPGNQIFGDYNSTARWRRTGRKGTFGSLIWIIFRKPEKVLSYIPDSDNQVRQKEVSDMLSMISYAEENGIKRAKKKVKKG